MLGFLRHAVTTHGCRVDFHVVDVVNVVHLLDFINEFFKVCGLSEPGAALLALAFGIEALARKLIPVEPRFTFACSCGAFRANFP